jgi:hypothetical protein
VKRASKLEALKLLGSHRRMWGEDKPTPPAPEGPGLTVVIEQRMASGNAGPSMQQVVVSLQPPER